MNAAGTLTSPLDAALPRQPARRGRQRFLVVRLAGKEFALDARRIYGITQMRGLPIENLQGPDGWNRQVVLHGRPLPVFTPNRAAGRPERPVSARTCLLLIASEVDSGQPLFVLQADSVSRFEELAPAFIRGNSTDGRCVRLGERWRPVIGLDDLTAAFYAWSRDLSDTTN